MYKIAAFIVLSSGLLYISRTSLRRPGSHGFYRFFAWECILGLFLLNVDAWFHNPLRWNQLISWFLLFASLIPLFYGVRTLVGGGKPNAEREGQPELLAFEKTTLLVTSGIYAYIRHPLYSSLLLLAWGIFFKVPGLPGGLAAAASTILLIATARADEAECLGFFGEEYQAYMITPRCSSRFYSENLMPGGNRYLP